MGYTTDFTGKFTLDKPLTVAHLNYLTAFAQTRRMSRVASETAKLSDPIREAVGLPIGEAGGYFVGSTNDFGQDRTPDIADYNHPPNGQPGLWCHWVPTEDGTAIVWDEGEKFYSYVKWIEYLIKHFLAPWGYVLNGEMEWSGEDRDDLGKIIIFNNDVRVLTGKVTYA